MSPTDYILDCTLVLIVLLQLRDRKLTSRQLLRPIVILTIAVVSYLHGIPTAGNDLTVAAAIGAVGLVIGVASGATVIMHTNASGEVMFRAGAASVVFWVLGMGSRFAFAVWAASGSGAASIGRFSAQHSITSAEAWTVALLGMAVCEVVGRTAVMALRRTQLAGGGRAVLA